MTIILTLKMSFKPVDQKSYEKYQKNFIVNKANKQNYKILIENLR